MLIPAEVELKQITKAKAFPVSYSWSRLEGRPVTDNFDRALKAEVRDALWMLTRQWQLGEFEGDDAGSPVTVKLSTSAIEVNKYKADDQTVQSFNKNIPFEATVEQRPVPFNTLQQDLSLDLRLIMGRRWLLLLKNKGLLDAPMKQFFLDHYGIRKPAPTNAADAGICAHPETWQQYAAVAGRMVDGGKLYLELKDNTVPHYYDLPDFPPADHTVLDGIEKEFRTWFSNLLYQPEDPINDAWKPEQLEYQFAISAPAGNGEKVLHAEEYYHGHLDWYNVDVAKDTPTLGELPPDAPPPPVPVKITQSLIPAPVQFEGMPNTRWWAFEDSRTNFSYVKPDTAELAKLLLIEFGLIYANDWYLIPYKLPVGTLTSIKGLTLTNSFGENFWIDAAGKGDTNDFLRWNMFSMKVDSATPVPTDNDLLLLPTVAKIQESKAQEEVLFIRDEMANMVWGVETIIPLPGGTSKSGFEAAVEYHSFLQKLIDDSGVVLPPGPPVKDGDEEARIRYEVMNAIPENWIPFVPAHVEGSNREVQLQRAAMPRILNNDPKTRPDKIRPRTSLLQYKLAEKGAYFIHEEEVPRSGVRVAQSYQRTRWNDGKVFVWFGVRKTTGKGEGSSGLGFDRIVNRPADTP
ncbi:hypothetical protein [Chitinophaga pinensis]|uniref:Uncharacterized protein n=1 Tax=Chitinophaga pinensis (strain ATCC 43595 / DSM 2588 / LMG 13176 / NBRC 15968 / NCIMB 11800 / UQM 2034) TaxID=485918 RepID=A0A979G462_CHIPD|nr:hypothetical protein [Chitinophaga pinensis]ACU60465.1 hypothetical protein Cpin_2989 [Chitinophaga pinensis DSM 2588]